MVDKLDGMSMNIEAEARARLRSVFPECFVEGELDIDKLLTMCGEYITNDFEKYKFEWHGKGDSMKLAQMRSAACLRPAKDESVDFYTTQNLYIEGDNLEVLKLLQTAYFRQVKMIYIDPPYNTGHDFVYEDDFKDPLKRYLEVTSQATKSNPETMGRFHTAWLNMMYPRLRLAANLLRDDGVIFISIDDGEVFNLKKVCDEVFGEENFVASVIWEKKYSPANDAKWLSDNHDYILIYAKQKELWRPQLLPRNDEQNSRYTNRDNDPRGDWKAADMTVKSYSAAYDYPITTPSGRVVNPSEGRCWNTSKENFEKLVKDNRIWFGENGDNMPSVKKFLSEVKDGVVPLTIWKYEDVGHNQEGRQELKKLFDDKGYFDGPKPVRLLKRILHIADTKDDDIILDFFSGSATTAHAVMQLNAEDGGNRKFICVQLPEVTDENSEAYKAGYKNICEIGKERIRRAGKKLKAFAMKDTYIEEEIDENPDNIQIEWLEKGKTNTATHEKTIRQTGIHERLDTTNLDVGFKVFKLDSSNLKLWDGIPVGVGNGQQYFDKIRNVIDGVKDDRPAIDVVYELMLKLGVPLTCEVEEKVIMDKTVYSADGDLLLFCLENDITAEFVEAMADLAPAKIIVAEMGFADDTAMANAHYILQDRGIEIKLV